MKKVFAAFFVTAIVISLTSCLSLFGFGNGFGKSTDYQEISLVEFREYLKTHMNSEQRFIVESKLDAHSVGYSRFSLPGFNDNSIVLMIDIDNDAPEFRYISQRVESG